MCIIKKTAGSKEFKVSYYNEGKHVKMDLERQRELVEYVFPDGENGGEHAEELGDNAEDPTSTRRHNKPAPARTHDRVAGEVRFPLLPLFLFSANSSPPCITTRLRW